MWVRKEEVSLKPILKNEFPTKGEQHILREVRHLSKEEVPGRGSKAGGVAAASKAPSAAIVKVLSGVEFPKQKQDLIGYPENSKSKVEVAEQVIQVIRGLPDKTYDSMTDLERAVGQVR
ncbi:MAG TPA: DUF2795 domain-containing protein [Nitrososphaera sp.]|nr:DUF2795 domain-containing protein [Nitrososphaera sp.]